MQAIPINYIFYRRWFHKWSRTGNGLCCNNCITKCLEKKKAHEQYFVWFELTITQKGFDNPHFSVPIYRIMNEINTI